MSLHYVLPMAWRNLWRNRRRSLVTITSLAFGFCALAVFAGYTTGVYNALANSSVHGELVGHLTINRVGWETEGKLHPEKLLLTADEIARIQAIVARHLPGATLLPRLNATGLMSNGHSSTIFVAMGVEARDLAKLRGPFRDVPGGLSENKPAAVSIGQGLADILAFKNGDSGSLLASTVHGQTNVADVDIDQIFNTGNAATNDKLMRVPLAMMQSLLDAPGRAESLTVLLPSSASGDASPAGGWQSAIFKQDVPGEERTRTLAAELTSALKAAGLDMQVRTWQEMSVFYRQVKIMYDMIFTLMLAVVLAIVVLSIANAMSMAVVERTREIGTLRAIGFRRMGIASLFVSEALLLVLIGTAAGMALMALVRFGVNLADIRWVPPNSTSAVPLYIGFDGARTMVAAWVLGGLAVLAAFLPARRAAQAAITDSLGHV
jgi:putative ABC transport system permease protein